jgi:DNA-binding transcriptional MerR regulator
MALLIKQVAVRARVSIDTIKRAEKRGLITSQRDINNWRRYSPDVVEKLKKLYVVADSDQPPPEAA